MDHSRIDTLKVPGATLRYEVRGEGSVLLLIPGGPEDASGFAPLRDVLSEHYTVLTYDPRGLSRSSFDGEPQDTTVETFADDAHRLLTEVGSEPAYVLGNSGGALVGLELVIRHPEQVRGLIAHEPPATWLLEDADEHARFGREVYETYRTKGIGPAMGKFLASIGLDQDPPQPPADPSPERAEAMSRMIGNMEFFLGHMLVPLDDYAPDISRLRYSPLTVAVGETSEGQLAHRAALVLAEQLGKETVVFPGGHGGFETHPDAFARRLDEVLRTY